MGRKKSKVKKEGKHFTSLLLRAIVRSFISMNIYVYLLTWGFKKTVTGPVTES